MHRRANHIYRERKILYLTLQSGIRQERKKGPQLLCIHVLTRYLYVSLSLCLTKNLQYSIFKCQSTAITRDPTHRGLKGRCKIDEVTILTFSRPECQHDRRYFPIDFQIIKEEEEEEEELRKRKIGTDLYGVVRAAGRD